MIKYGIIILAAGNSSRLGTAKQLLPYNGDKLITHTLKAVIPLQHVFPIVVTGAEKDAIAAELSINDVHQVYNENWQSGISSSIKAGLKEMLKLKPEIKACILCVCDQPFISRQVLEALVTAYSNEKHGIIASFYADTAGTPALFDKKYFDEMLKLEGIEGAKKLFKRHKEDLQTIPFKGGEFDIDTMEDYQKLLQINIV